MDEARDRISELARDILRLSRNLLLVNLRFLNAALSRLELQELPELAYATDGRTLVYDPRHVLKCYRQERAVPVRDYLQIVLHCVYRHMFIHTLVDHAAWDLACDIAVEYTITGLGLRAAAASREVKQQAVYQKLEREIGTLTAEKIYRYYLDRNMTPVEMADLRGLFYADDHRVWYLTDEEKTALGIGQRRGENDGESGGSNADGGAAAAPCSEADWQSVSERMQMDLETFSKGQ